jgi:acylaminoacyl-peptidase
MHSRRFAFVALLTCCAVRSVAAVEPDPSRFQLRDVFSLEFAADPQISPDGTQVVYVRNFFDIMTDRQKSNLWIINADGSDHRPLTTGNRNDTSPRWSPDGGRLLYASNEDGQTQLYCRWMDTGDTARLTNLTSTPASLEWSRDARWIAFTMHVPDKPQPFVELPEKPEGAEWAPAFKVVRQTLYRLDGQGYHKEGYHHLFVLPAEGGTPRQLTSGDFDHQSRPAWSADGKSLIISSNRGPEWEYHPEESNLYAVNVETGETTPLTDRVGPDHSPAVSPDGKLIAYVGYDDRKQGYQVMQLSVMNADGTEKRIVSEEFDRDVEAPVWSSDGKGLFFQYDDHGTTKVGYLTLAGEVSTVAEPVGGVTLGRPYASGSFSVSAQGDVAFTFARPDRPADVAVSRKGGAISTRPLTDLNDDLFGHKQLGSVEEMRFQSAADQREVQAWLVKPPEFDASPKYPLILEIHGGPFANYGPRFSAEIQLYAAAGYVVLYVNPRGSTSYGAEFGNLIHHAYPGDDYQDLMSAVDAVLERGFVDADQLYVTGGSGGGILTAWIVGHTNRFRAAVAAKPVINWYSFTLTADVYTFFDQYWFPCHPWENAEHYLQRSPLTYVGNVTTPTMLLTGEEDHRTPISESEQFYQALKLRKIDTALVRVPGASHNIAARPSHLMAKVAHVLKWFELHNGD